MKFPKSDTFRIRKRSIEPWAKYFGRCPSLTRATRLYGGLLTPDSMLEKLGFEQLVELTLTARRQTWSTPSF
jgi:hypothetical protein